MDVFDKITISHFIWYLVPGLGLIVFLLIPLLVFNPHITRLIFQGFGPFGISILAIILGFFLDGLRLYRFRPKYSEIRKKFFQHLQTTIDKDLDPYFILSHISDVARNKNVTGLSLRHAIWIMLGQFTILGFLESFFWILATIYFSYFSTSPYSLFGTEMCHESVVMFCGGFAILFLIISYRLLNISTEDQEITNKMYSSFAEQHCDEIRQLLNVTPNDVNISGQ